MTGIYRWKAALSQLREFVAKNPEIIISANEISIPQSLRDEFYQRFDAVREGVVTDYLDVLPVNARILSEQYIQAEREVSDLLSIAKVGMPVDLHAFLHNPEAGLIRVLYNRLFDLLQGKIAEDQFEEMAVIDLRASATDLFRLGYERWVGLIMIKLLDPDQAFGVELDEDLKPYLSELSEISFGRQAHHPTLRIPEFVVHSRKFDCLVAIKMALALEIEGYVVAFKPAVKPKKKTGDTSLALDSRVMLLTFLKGPKDIPIYADIYECTRTSPDFVIDFISKQELGDGNALLQVNRRYEALNPKYGASLIVVGDSTASISDSIPNNMCAVFAGFNQKVLGTMADSILVSQQSAEENG
jgi:hypothetical protein